MTTDQKVIKNKLGVLRLAEMLGNVSEACRVMGNSLRQLLPLQGALRPQRRGGAAGDQPSQAGAEESRGARDRGGGIGVRYCAAGVGARSRL